MSQISLLSLDEDILHLILLQLWQTSPTSVCTFSRVSKATQKLANPIIWRIVKIGKAIRGISGGYRQGNPLDQKYVERAGVENLLEKPFLLDLVKEIEIRENGGKDKVITDDEQAEIITGAKSLVKFSWNSESPIRHEAVAALEERSSDVDLHVSRQSDIYSSRSLDLNLLGCSNLKVLTHNISWTRSSLFDRESSKDTLDSHLEKLDEALSRSTSIKILNLSLNILNSIISIPTASAVEMKIIDFPDTVFENLLSITIPADYGNSNRSPHAHQILTSLLLSKIHKWKSVQELHLTGLHASYAFTHLRDRTPKLRKIDLMFPSYYSNQGSLDPNLVAKFLTALENLEDLKIADMNQVEVDMVWPAIVKQKKSLRKLDLYARADLGVNAPVWNASHFDELLVDSSIKSLALQVSIPTLQEWCTTTTTIPISINTLQTLELSTHIPTDIATIFSEKYDYDTVEGSAPPPPLDMDNSMKIAKGIFKSSLVKGAQEGGNGGIRLVLGELKVCLVRLGIWDRGQTEEIKTTITVWENRGGIDFNVVAE